MKYEESGNPAPWLAREIADSANAASMAKCECMYQHQPQCAEGQRLMKAIEAAEKAWQDTPLSDGTRKLVYLHDKFTEANRAYFEHVQACSINA